MKPHPLSTKPYADVARSGKPVAQRERITAELMGQPAPLNRRMISQLTRIPINVVTWRVKGMLESGLLEVAFVAKDPVTEQDTEFLRLTGQEPRQLDFGL